MCGIWGLLSKNKINKQDNELYYNLFNNLKGRGPDHSTYLSLDNFILGFHRLSINDKRIIGSQPFQHIDRGLYIYVLCNGEIYNSKELINKYSLESEVKSNSDCEVIIHLLKLYNYDLTKVIKLLNGEFSIICCIVNSYDGNITYQYARDPFGVRPLYHSLTPTKLYLSSLLKGIPYKDQVYASQVDPRYVYSAICGETITVSKTPYYELDVPRSGDIWSEGLIKKSFVRAVEKRLISDRDIGALLSGGLDSSLVCAIAAKLIYPKRLHTFSIGIKGSSDLEYARLVSRYINSIHTEVHFTPEEGLSIIPELVYCLETFDITTIRASVGQYLLSKYISENTSVKVLLNGDGSDEVAMGYLYLHNYPTVKELVDENYKLMSNIHYFDVLRVDRCISNFGLESRVPFLDIDFVTEYLKAPIEDRIPNCKKYNSQEKGLLRSMFKDDNLLPSEVLYRRKEAFSDGVSSKEKKWYQVIQEYVSEMEIKDNKQYKNLLPYTLESKWYRFLYSQNFNNEYIIPNFWLPNWTTTTDPSATTLSNY